MFPIFLNLYKRFSLADENRPIVCHGHAESSAGFVSLVESLGIVDSHSGSLAEFRDASTGGPAFVSSYAGSSSIFVNESVNEKTVESCGASEVSFVSESLGIVLYVEVPGRSGGGMLHRYPNVAAADPARLKELKDQNAVLREELEQLRDELNTMLAGGPIELADLSEEEQALILMMLGED